MKHKLFCAKDQLEIFSLGMEIALTEILGASIGYWLDVKFDTLPWCLIGGVSVGFVLGLVQVVETARSAAKKLKQKDNNGRS